MDCVVQLIQRLKSIRPRKVYVFSDGARSKTKGEKASINEIRKYINSAIDWDCQVLTRFNKENEGCKYGVSNAISWFFSQEEAGIILEDDCIPNHSFFLFCETLLAKYRSDESILHIGGTNPLGQTEIAEDYYFSYFNRIWGWASWRRAWSHFDPEIKDWPRLKQESVLLDFFNKKTAKYYTEILDDVYEKKIDTWDYQWFLCRLINGLAIIPKNNLISNIGFNKNATHTKDSSSVYASLDTSEISFPLIHPSGINRNQLLDREWERVLTKSSLIKELKKIIKKVLK